MLLTYSVSLHMPNYNSGVRLVQEVITTMGLFTKPIQSVTTWRSCIISRKEVDGENIGALLLASNNKLYGLNGAGGQGGGSNVFQGGTFFEYDLVTDQFRVIEHLGPLSTNLPNVVMPKAEGQKD